MQDIVATLLFKKVTHRVVGYQKISMTSFMDDPFDTGVTSPMFSIKSRKSCPGLRIPMRYGVGASTSSRSDSGRTGTRRCCQSKGAKSEVRHSTTFERPRRQWPVTITWFLYWVVLNDVSICIVRVFYLRFFNRPLNEEKLIMQMFNRSHIKVFAVIGIICLL